MTAPPARSYPVPGGGTIEQAAGTERDDGDEPVTHLVFDDDRRRDAVLDQLLEERGE